MRKHTRLELFKEKLDESKGESTAVGARNLMADILKTIEDKYAPADEKKMIIPDVNEKTVQEYGTNGLYIPLIGHRIYINENGAIRIKDFNTENVYLEKKNMNGISFNETVGWKPRMLNT